MKLRLIINIIVTVSIAGCGGEPTAEPVWRLVREDPTDLPLRGLTDAEQEVFDRGDVLFEREYRASQGLGPVFIRASCASCHAGDGRGPGFVERVVAVEDDGVTPARDQSLMPFGAVLRPYFVEPATRGIDAPGEGMGRILRTRRAGSAVFGRGWMEAIDEAEIVRVAGEQARAGRVHGRVPRLADGRLGRFGLKARVVTLEEFAADAFRGDMGLTSPLYPEEVPNPDGLRDDARPGVDLAMTSVTDVGLYLRALAIPRREGLTAAGRAVFERSGCADCHVPSLRTRADAAPGVLRATDAAVYTDMLLHDMGRELSDASAEGAAGPREWRTAPLLGLRHFRSYLHDGRAGSLDAAVRMHAGEGSDANASVRVFEALPDSERALLLDYIGRL